MATGRQVTLEDLAELPSLPKDFEPIFLQSVQRVREIALAIKEQRSRFTMAQFGGSASATGATNTSATPITSAPTVTNAAGTSTILTSSLDTDGVISSAMTNASATTTTITTTATATVATTTTLTPSLAEQQPLTTLARVSLEIFIPGHRAGLVIGHHGETLKRIEKMSQCKIQFDQHFSSAENERRVVISGFAEDVQEAKRLIMEKVEDPISRFPSFQLTVPHARVGLLIGKGGETIRELQERSGAKITVQQDHAADPLSSERLVTIIGDEDSIQRAKELIHDLISGQMRGGLGGGGHGGGGAHGTGHGGAHGGFGGGTGGSLSGSRNVVTIQIPESSVGAVIGKRAETLRGLQSMSGCRIFVEQASQASLASNLRSVHLTGSAEQVAYAQQLINERVTANETAAAYYASFENVTQPTVIYQNPTDFGMSAAAAASGTVGMSPYDYNQYYAQQYYAQQPAFMPAIDPSAAAYSQQSAVGGGVGGVGPSTTSNTTTTASNPAYFDYAAYAAQYNQYYHQQQQQPPHPQQ